jgi:hypothetical protein
MLPFEAAKDAADFSRAKGEMELAELFEAFSRRWDGYCVFSDTQGRPVKERDLKGRVIDLAALRLIEAIKDRDDSQASSA